jgi:hypothetical protein
MKAPETEKVWLNKLNRAVQASLVSKPGGAALEIVKRAEPERTDASSEGWWVSVARIVKSNATLCLFIDNSHPFEKRGLWYGVAETSRSGITAVERAGFRRWPYTQRIKGYETPKDLRFDDPWYQRYDSDEYYYGWLDREPPDTDQKIPPAVVDRIVERFSNLLVELGNPSDGDGLDIESGDSLQTVKVRREQAQLRAWLFSGKPVATCFCCQRELPVELLIAAHIKARSICNRKERNDYTNNLIALCALGCDALFERGYLITDGKRFVPGPRLVTTVTLKSFIKDLVAMKREPWASGRDVYFDAHQKHHNKSAQLRSRGRRPNTR